ncbi:hypothetical protein SDC9_208434 [bioreactor metagenome]|uniref:Uncharacterized protein n=1 Tax=bioreactor metagenome TaxID=1076179 RepID=A0A645JM67_9ZZZZ
MQHFPVAIAVDVAGGDEAGAGFKAEGQVALEPERCAFPGSRRHDDGVERFRRGDRSLQRREIGCFQYLSHLIGSHCGFTVGLRFHYYTRFFFKWNGKNHKKHV